MPDPRDWPDDEFYDTQDDYQFPESAEERAQREADERAELEYGTQPSEF